MLESISPKSLNGFGDRFWDCSGVGVYCCVGFCNGFELEFGARFCAMQMCANNITNAKKAILAGDFKVNLVVNKKNDRIIKFLFKNRFWQSFVKMICVKTCGILAKYYLQNPHKNAQKTRK